MTYLVLYFVSIVSPLLAIAEPLVVLSAMSGRSNWLALAIVVALGQSTGFAILYFFGEQVLARLQSLKRKLDEFDFARFERSKISLTALSGLFGMPPASVLAAAGNIFEPNSLRFLSVLFLGRVVRFGVLGAVPAVFVSIFDPELVPEWVKNLF